MSDIFKQGSYLQSYFLIGINTNLSLEKFENLYDYERRIFIHEYTHFLQNIMGGFGHTHIWKTFDGSRQLISYEQKNGEKELVIPVENEVMIKEKSLSQVMNTTLGSYHVKKGMDDNLTKVVSVNAFKDSCLAKLQPQSNELFLNLHLEDANKITMDYVFGEYAVSETMAFLMESKFYETDPAPNFPYKVCEHIGKYLETNILDNKEFMFALCDVATLFAYPGNAFYKILLNMHRRDFVPTSSKEIIDYGIDFMYNQGWDVWKDFRKSLEGALISAKELFKYPLFKETVEWFQYILEAGYQTRYDNPYIMLDLYGEKDAFTGTWLSILKHFGAPQILNAKDERFLWPPAALMQKKESIEPFLFLALHEVYNTLVKQSAHCNLYNVCMKSTNGLKVDSRCENAPWERGKDELTCAFGGLWTAYLLNDKKVELRPLSK